MVTPSYTKKKMASTKGASKHHPNHTNLEQHTHPASQVSQLAKRSKQTRRQEKPSEVTKPDGTKKLVHKYKRKKRFGKSINDRSPSLLKERLKQKCTQYGLLYLETDKWMYRASQYRHDNDDYQKTALSERFKVISGYMVQRDVYSAFLQSCMETPEKPDRNKCMKQFDNFVKMQESLITQMKESGKSFPPCFGF